MIPNIIKYVSVDGLSRFQEWRNPTRRPDNRLDRIGVVPVPISAISEREFREPMITIRRSYDLHDAYVDESNGNRVFEYRERP